MRRFKFNHYNTTLTATVIETNGRKNMGTIQLENGVMTKKLYRDIVKALCRNKVEYLN
ncbi:hypothetical protein [Heyndrickxia camelliae]|uniref:hypothetical protein n=1 Tax=Heyndrickxia camelliae TaxID=1707093 RepID=UPI0013FDAC23|nr:hypothetical protein [Heyndrickxia camelliae]